MQRVAGLAADDLDLAATFIVGNEEHRFLMLDQLREIKLEPSALLLEPIGRNTAPALTIAAQAALGTGNDPVLVVTLVNQTVTDQSGFTNALQQAVREAATGAIVILGISPNWPETGYGYIHAQGANVVQAVQGFVEKPDLSTAQAYLAEGGYFWNAGMFVLKASVWIAALERFRPDIAQATRTAWEHRTTDAKFIRPGKAEFTAIPAESVDYAVMEHCPGSEFPIKMISLSWLERPRRLGCRLARISKGRSRQCSPRGCDQQRQSQHPGPCHQPSGESCRRRQPRGNRNPRCRASRPSFPQSGRQSHRRATTRQRS